MKNLKRIFLFLLLLTTIISCKHDRNDTGRAYFPDMATSEAYETYSENPVFKNAITMQQPVEGTIPREMIPYQIEDKTTAGEELENPFTAKKENLRKGKEQFEIFCANCHGHQGKGDGYLYTAKLFNVQPLDLSNDLVQNKKDGNIYHTISKGSIVMGAHASQIKAKNRWKIILFIKNNFKTE